MHLCVDARMYHASGIGTYLQNLLPALAESFELTLIGHPRELDAIGEQTIPTDIPIYSVAELLRFPSHIPPCDVFWSPHYNVPLLPIKAKKRLVTIHDVFHLAFFSTLSLKQQAYARLMFRAAARRSVHIITVSAFSKAEIIKYLKVKPSWVTVIPNGVNHQQFRVIREEEVRRQVQQTYALPPKFVLYVGNVKPHKNLLTLVKAFAALPATPDHHLVIVGKKGGFITGDPLLHERISQDERLARRVHFTGFVEQAHLPVLYNLAELFVFPSYYEGFGLPPLEAMACGCPVLASERASMPEICGDAALYIDPDCPETMAAKIQDALLLPSADRQLVVQKGLEQAQTYTWEKAINHHRQLIRHLSS